MISPALVPGWEVVDPLGADGSCRRYDRVRRGAQTALLMQSVPDGAPGGAPGHGISDYVKISAWLRSLGLSAPAVYEASAAEGWLLIEDFGDLTFRRALEAGVDRARLYERAIEVLVRLGAARAPLPAGLPDYVGSHIDAGRRRIVDWFIPLHRRAMNPEGLADSYLRAWREVEGALGPACQGFLHCDFHIDNLMWLPDRDGAAQCGVLDFQGAMRGPLPYDLANLLEDVRTAIPDDLRASLMDRYCAAFDGVEADSLRLWARVLGTQFHCRVAGQFIKMALRSDKRAYLDYLPRTLALLREGLSAPVLAPVRVWFAENGIDLRAPPDVNPETARHWIRADAF